MDPVPNHDRLHHIFATRDLKRTSILSKAAEYARWTLPYVFPETGTTETTELQLSADSIGAQAVNHLSNKVVSTLFPGQRLFFRLRVDAEAKKLINAAAQAEAQDEDVNDQVKQAISKLELELANIEAEAQEYMDMVAYRPEATHAAKLLIITGNALIYHPEGQPVRVYSMRDYVVVRDVSGAWIELITRESKTFETFAKDVQEQIMNNPLDANKKYLPDTEVTIYTQVKLDEGTGKYVVKQEADNVDLGIRGASYPKAIVPWIPLTWNLIRGEDYGRGLVGDFAGAFHAINIMSQTLLNLAAIMGDIKFLVDPQSSVNVAALNNSPAGSYHSGKLDAVGAIQTNKQSDAQFIATMIDRYQKQISQAFLLNSNLTRQAERVTAEEIRRDAEELETSNGGIYSALAAKWQVPTANITLDAIGFEGIGDGIIPQIVTGMDSLSRAGELENLQVWIGYLTLLQNVPEDVRARIKISDYMKYVGVNTQVDSDGFTKTEAEFQAEMQQAQEQAMAMEQQKQQAAGNAQMQSAAMQNQDM